MYFTTPKKIYFEGKNQLLGLKHLQTTILAQIQPHSEAGSASSCPGSVRASRAVKQKARCGGTAPPASQGPPFTASAPWPQRNTSFLPPPITLSLGGESNQHKLAPAASPDSMTWLPAAGVSGTATSGPAPPAADHWCLGAVPAGLAGLPGQGHGQRHQCPHWGSPPWPVLLCPLARGLFFCLKEAMRWEKTLK